MSSARRSIWFNWNINKIRIEINNNRRMNKNKKRTFSQICHAFSRPFHCNVNKVLNQRQTLNIQDSVLYPFAYHHFSICFIDFSPVVLLSSPSLCASSEYLFTHCVHFIWLTWAVYIWTSENEKAMKDKS